MPPWGPTCHKCCDCVSEGLMAYMHQSIEEDEESASLNIQFNMEVRLLLFEEE